MVSHNNTRHCTESSSDRKTEILIRTTAEKAELEHTVYNIICADPVSRALLGIKNISLSVAPPLMKRSYWLIPNRVLHIQGDIENCEG